MAYNLTDYIIPGNSMTNNLTEYNNPGNGIVSNVASRQEFFNLAGVMWDV